MEDDKDIQIPKELIESIGALNDAIAQQQDSAAAMLYRLMFRHERNINTLDHYADQVLDGVCGMGSSFAEEDYLNYLQYLRVVVPHEFDNHKSFFEKLREKDSYEDFELERFCTKDIENLNKTEMAEENNIPPMRSDFEQIKRREENGKEYWSARELGTALGYSTYQKFSRTLSKAIAVANGKVMKTADHFNQTVEMVKLGSGTYRKVENMHLSRMACLIITENADGKKPQVQIARVIRKAAVAWSDFLSCNFEF